MTGHPRPEPAIWRPQGRFVANIASLRQLQVFNDRGGIAVNFDTMRSVSPNIAIAGSQSETLSLWETRSSSGFVTKPKFDARLITIRFVSSGHIVYRRRSGNIDGLPTHATLVDFDDLREVHASNAFSAISGTFAVDTLMAANEALTGGDDRGLPLLAPLAEVATPGMKALFLSLQQVQRRIQGIDRHDDLIFPLAREVLTYQLLSAWPRRIASPRSGTRDVPSRSLRAALDYIEANLSNALVLADVAAAAGISVRSLQDKFRREIGLTPVQFIIDRRLAKAHLDLMSSAKSTLSIADIARSWGFVHMGDFGQRYRRLYGRAPKETRQGSRHSA
ncbi:helix-turn-helix domain-containing protein [Methylobacterium marchantiae]|uniref:Helix-turn-helix domain-containing protein n=1 Tax=Methylobacterium marchantiae TaxID=600331 RepID=A0ABW3WW84_9HYPH|nr:HTH-type transcriptional activator RhaS [Methylobacterium marchantiae]